MSLTTRVRSCFRDTKLVNVNVFRAFPFIVWGICIGEALILIGNRDWMGVLVTAVTFASAVACLVRTWRPEQLWVTFVVVIVGVLLSSILLALIMFDQRIPLPEDTLSRQRLNGTSCDDVELNTTYSSICEHIWVQELKSSLSLWTSNVGLLINAALIRPPSLDGG